MQSRPTPRFRRLCFFENSELLLAVNYFCIKASEAVIRRCSVKKVFLEISSNSQENACVKDFF